MTMGVFTIFFGRLAKLPSQGLPYPIFYFAALGAMGLFLAGAYELHKHRGGQPERDHESVFSPRLIFAGGGGIFRVGGFCDWSGGDGDIDAVFRDPPAGDGCCMLPVLIVLAVLDGARRGAVDVGTECIVSGCARG